MNLITVLNNLMENQGLSLDKLAKLTGVSRSNINRMRTDENCNPTISSLLPIATFFNLSVEQLIGITPTTDTHKYQLNSLKLEKLPVLINYKQVNAFISDGSSPKNANFTYTENTISTQSFGFITQDNSMQPFFPKGSTVVFDCQLKYDDQSYVLAIDLSNSKLLFKKYINQDNLEFLTALNPEDGASNITKLDNLQIIATAVECHMDLLK
jgi:transcriptional regulator with XRE-family HTH domain